jgi:hypothetical protein
VVGVANVICVVDTGGCITFFFVNCLANSYVGAFLQLIVGVMDMFI